MRHYSQSDYILARAKEIGIFTGVGFCFLRFLHSNHCAIFAVVRVGGESRLKKYRRKRQKHPLSLPLGPKGVDTMAFNALATKCVDLEPTRKPGKDWMIKAAWRLVAKQASLLQSSCIWQDAAWRMKCKIGATIRADKQKGTTNLAA